MKHATTCPLCGGNNLRPFYNYGAPNKVKVQNCICANCGAVFQNPRSGVSELKQYYEGYLVKTQKDIARIPRNFEEHVLAIARLRLRFLHQYLRQNDRVLDVGCSFGALLKVLRDESGMNLTVKGINPEQELANFGIKEYGLDIAPVMFEESIFPRNSFDLVILDNVIEHFAEPLTSLNNIWQLLAPHGRIFIATNNLDEPHGFLWQNFFLDHIVTFSPKTLTAALESQGFKILARDLSGHVTYEGYHYPYQYCVAEKTVKPKTYDFRANGEPADEKLCQMQQYVTQYGGNNRLSKRLYELGLETKRNWVQKVRLLAYKTLAMMSSSPAFCMKNHTFPPEEFFSRRVLVSVCHAESDVSETLRLANGSEFAPVTVILMGNSNGKLSLRACPQSLLLQDRSSLRKTFGGEEEFWTWFFRSVKPIKELVILRLNNADLKDDVLKRTYAHFSESGLEYCEAIFDQFAQAKWCFLRGSVFETLKETGNIDRENYDIKKKHTILWPEKEDYQYYCREKFEKYFSMPQAVALDLSPQCNKRCDKCQFHSSRSRKSDGLKHAKAMPLELALRIIDEVATWAKKPSISPTYSGEPLLYPELYQVIEHAKKLSLPFAITTNGLLLTREKSRSLLDLGVDSFLISIDAFNEQTYQELQPPGILEEITANVLRLVELRGKNKKPTIGVHFVMEERNQREFQEYLDFWGQRVDYVSMAIHQDQFAACQLTLPPLIPLGRKQACWSAWTSLYVRSDGGISFCGFDIERRSSALSVYDRSLLDIWNSDEYWQWRQAHLDNDRSVLYCRACPDWAANRTIVVRDGKRLITRSPFSEIYRLA